jgi:hypothetical protein
MQIFMRHAMYKNWWYTNRRKTYGKFYERLNPVFEIKCKKTKKNHHLRTNISQRHIQVDIKKLRELKYKYDYRDPLYLER